MKTVTPKLLNATKGLIPKNWLNSERPDLRKWFKQMDYYSKMELLGSKDKGQLDKYNTIWGGWGKYKIIIDSICWKV